MNQSYIIKGAVLSEKTYKQMESGIYTFLVSANVTKNQIAKTVENQFSVKVERVNLATRPAKTKRIARTRKMTRTQSSRKAIVYLEKGQGIEMLAPKSQKEKKSKLKDKKEKENAD